MRRRRIAMATDAMAQIAKMINRTKINRRLTTSMVEF